MYQNNNTFFSVLFFDFLNIFFWLLLTADSDIETGVGDASMIIASNDFYKFMEIYKKNSKITEELKQENFTFDINYHIEIYKEAELVRRCNREIEIKYCKERYIKNAYLLEEMW